MSFSLCDVAKRELKLYFRDFRSKLIKGNRRKSGEVWYRSRKLKCNAPNAVFVAFMLSGSLMGVVSFPPLLYP